MNRQQRIFLGVLFLLLVLNVTVLFVLDARMDQLSAEVDGIQEENEQYKNDLEAADANGISTDGVFASKYTTTTGLPMYDNSKNSGTIATLRVSSLPGSGTHLQIDDVAYRQTMQESITPAVIYAQTHSEYPPPFNAAYVDVETNQDWDFIDGDSLQLSVAIALMATGDAVEMDSTVIMSGAINDSGDVEQVGYIEAKAIAAREEGYETFLVPPNQSRSVDGITLIEVESVDEAADYALQSAEN